MKNANMAAKAIGMTFILSSNLTFAEIAPVPKTSVGNDIGSSQFADGPGNIAVTLGDCKFSINLAKDDHIRFNDPDMIIYRSATRFSDNRMPYLSQTEMAAGYDWSFKKKGRLDDRWIGIMCESTSNFSWGIKNIENVTPELTQIIATNSYRCPAKFTNNAWNPISMGKGVKFRALDGKGWSGVVVAYLHRNNQTKLERINICIVQGSNVLIGASENFNGTLRIPVSFFDEIAELMSSIEFDHSDKER
ncbi:hypothetical protein Tamer19_12500 [Cupriavidus sp. TA19]|uniref:hypothetical protein n=1 Tax=unclassified Cupriavidus TaxID=2640874 RepID=UPI002729471E|nr:hypothetical protein [Cupriavidus sp. TA19]GLC91842.1 hypothetical protein Tamer19_12500 [Cupriavidus sp. TA19]